MDLREDLRQDLQAVTQCFQKAVAPGAALAQLVQKSSCLAPSEVTRFEALIRGHTAYSSELGIEALASFPSLAWIWLFHGNGYCREAALKHLPDEPLSSFYLTALFWRSNDWVSQVRAAAEQQLSRVLQNVSVEVATDTAVFLFHRLGNWTRMSPEAFGQVAALLQRQDVQEELIRRFTAGTDDCRTSEMNACLRFDFLDSHLPALARNSKNPAIRRLALRVLQNGYVEIPLDVHTVITDKIYGKYKLVRNAEHRSIAEYKDLPSLIRVALADKSVFVRRMAADGLIMHRTSFQDVDALAKTLLADRKASIRERGEFLLRTDGHNKPKT
jgi:hypothetical protein